MKVRFLQTADPVVYRRMIEVTSQTVREFCARNGFEYECFLGIRRGFKPWHAALNRIPILQGYINAGYDGWVVYMDADAYIADLDFDLKAYLADKAGYALIAAPSNREPPQWWDINNGVFIVNLGSPKAVEFIGRVNARLDAISDDALRAEEKWSDVVDDQGLFHETLYAMPEMQGLLLSDDQEPRILNYKSRFIQQFLRVVGTVESRVEMLAVHVAEALGEEPPDVAAMRQSRDKFVRAAYRVLLDRDPEPGGYRYMMDAMERFGSNYEEQLRAVVNSREYQNRIHAMAAARSQA